MIPHVDIVEVGPRDGLQSEARILPVATRVDLIRQLVAAGAHRIEVASFVHPRLVPQMAGAEEICDALGERREWSAIGLVLNGRGLDRALDTDVDEINVVAYASDGYAEKNTGATAAVRNAEAADLIARAAAAGRRTSVTISVAFGDPVEGDVPAERVVGIAGMMVEAGAGEVALGDTIGVAVPTMVTERVAAVREATPDAAVRCHFHNTHNTAYANVFAALAAGVEALDASVGGYGGSPFAPQAGGNVATEDVAWMLERSGVGTGLDGDSLVATARWLAAALGSHPRGMLSRPAE
jgi:hydroxymethylglutaryl-CoA lyase